MEAEARLPSVTFTYSVEEVQHQEKNWIKYLAHYHKGAQVFVFITLCRVFFVGKVLFRGSCELMA